MGTYIPQRTKKKKTISEALREAEEEHWLDCAPADPPIRVAAFLLDLIFISLMFSSLERVLLAIQRLPWITVWMQNHTAIANQINLYLLVGMRIAVIYYTSLWSVHRFGGTAGKFILGLRVIHEKTGQPLSLGQTLLREVIGKFGLSSLSLGTALLIPLIRKDHLALHDILSRSAVKKMRHAR